MVLRPEPIQDIVEQVNVIHAKIKVVQDRQKSYVDLRRKPTFYEVGDKV